MLVALVAGFGAATDYFFTATTLRTIANQLPDILLVSTGMTLVVIAGGIDLSVGSILALSGAVLGVAIRDWHLPMAAAVALSLLVGAACGAINGVLVTRWALPSFIVTLGMLEVARGAAYLVTGSQTKYIGGAIERLTTPIVGGLGTPFFLAVAVVAAAQFVLIRTVYGRHLIAVGANETAAWLSGVRSGTRSRDGLHGVRPSEAPSPRYRGFARLAAAGSERGIGLNCRPLRRSLSAARASWAAGVRGHDDAGRADHCRARRGTR